MLKSVCYHNDLEGQIFLQCSTQWEKGAKISKIYFFGLKICIKSGFLYEPKIVNISHCAVTTTTGPANSHLGAKRQSDG